MSDATFKFMNVDCFSSLDDVPRKHEGNPHVVLAAVKAAGGRFSVFDATRTAKMASTMTALERSGWWRRSDDEGYPWVRVEITPEGEAALAAAGYLPTQESTR